MSKARDIADRKLDGTDLELGDNDKAVFGDGSDLQIYHNGSNNHSYIEESGAGGLIVRAGNIYIQDADGHSFIYCEDSGTAGKVELSHGGSAKLVTTSTGVDVTGTVTADGLTVDAGSTSLSLSSNDLAFDRDTFDAYIRQKGSNGSLTISTNDGVSDKNRVSIQGDGDVAFYEDTGTTAKFFWDASAESLGIGTSSPTEPLTLSKVGYTGVLIDNTDATGTSVSLKAFDTTYGAALSAEHFLRVSTSGSERMRIDASGNVGIGTSSPSSPLEVVSAGGLPIIATSTSSKASIAFEASGTTYRPFIGADGDNLHFSTGSAYAERMRIDSSGNLLVGTTSFNGFYSGGKNFNVGDFSNTGTADGVTIETNGSEYVYRTSTTQTANVILMDFYNPNGRVGSISTNGSSTSYTTSSDYRLKEDWQPMVSNFDRVSALNPVNFAWKADGSRVDGFLAHELAEVVPEAVTGTKDAMTTEEYEVTPAVFDDEGNVVTESVMGEREVPDYQAIDQSKLVPLLTAALQDAIAKIETLEADVALLKGTN